MSISRLFLLLLAVFYASGESASPYVIGGSTAQRFQSSHTVHLNFKTSGIFFCGGSLINEQWVVSAAHCYQPANSFYVVAGDYDQQEDDGSEVNTEVELVAVHPMYVKQTHDFDVMLVKLKSKVSFNDAIQPVKLPEPMEVPQNETLCQVCGWGNVIMTQGNFYPERLRCVDVSFIDSQACDVMYSGQISDSMLCFGDDRNGGKDACDGDSGGPVVCNGILHGVVSWGYGCANPVFPGVYGKLSVMIDWIESVIQVGSQ